MTTYHDPPVPDQNVKDPFANKAIATALTTLLTVGVQWAASEDLGLEQEGITAAGGALATLLVWLVSNWKRKGV